MSNISLPSTLIRIPSQIVQSVSYSIDYIVDFALLTLINTMVKLYTYEKEFQAVFMHALSTSATKTDHLYRRLFTTPPFDPETPHFIETLESNKKYLEILNDEINQIISYFDDSSFIDELKKVACLKREVESRSKEINECLSTMEIYYPSSDKIEQVKDVKARYEALSVHMKAQIDRVKPRIEEKWNELCDSITLATDFASTHQFETDIIQNIQIFLTHILPDTRFNIPTEALSEAEALTLKEEYMMKLPFVLKNVGNSCYLASALQALFCLDETRTRLCRKLENRVSQDELAQQIKIQKQTVQLVNKLRAGQPALFSFFETTPLQELREAIFASKLHADLSNPSSIWSQHDAAYVVELFMRDILGYGFNTLKIFSADEIPGRIFSGPIENNYTLQLTLKDKKLCDLQDCIDDYFKNHSESDGRRFEISEGVVTDRSKIQPNELTVTAKTYYYKTFLEDLPDVMALHVKRFGAGLNKLETEVVLPIDGKLDFFTSELEQASGEIVGYIMHHGMTIGGGHYTARIKRDGRFFDCNDGVYHEITRAEFYAERQAYIVLVKKS